MKARRTDVFQREIQRNRVLLGANRWRRKRTASADVEGDVIAQSD